MKLPLNDSLMDQYVQLEKNGWICSTSFTKLSSSKVMERLLW